MSCVGPSSFLGLGQHSLALARALGLHGGSAVSSAWRRQEFCFSCMKECTALGVTSDKVSPVAIQGQQV